MIQVFSGNIGGQVVTRVKKGRRICKYGIVKRKQPIIRRTSRTHRTASGPPGRSLKMKTFNSVLSSAVVILSIVSSRVAKSSESL